jgi:Ca-activated chloride channel homolog
MNFNYELGIVEYVFIALFILLYALYIGRTVLIAKKLRTLSRSILIKFFLRGSYFVLFLITLMGPSFGDAERNIKTEGKDVYVLIDVSRSMDATDIAPSRLEKAKFELQNFYKSFHPNRCGLVTFATDAFIQVPLSHDLNTVDVFTQLLNTEITSAKGTDICKAIDLITKKILDQTKNNTSKIILLLTDGEDFGVCESQQLNTLRRFGIQLVTVGIGTTNGGKIAVGNGWLKDNDNQVVVSKLDKQYLQNITQKARGSYFEINEHHNGMVEALTYINSLENTSLETNKVLIINNKYRYVLVLVLVLIVLDVLVTITTIRL